MGPFDAPAWPDRLPGRYWLADVHVPRALREAPGNAARVALLVEDGAIAAVEGTPSGDAPVFQLQGATALPAFVDVHTHLDKGDLLAMGLSAADTLRDAVDVARADYQHWSDDELRHRIVFGLRTAYAHGIRALNTHCDWPQPHGNAAWRVLQALRAEWKGRVDLHVTALVDTADFGDADRAGTIARTVAAGRGRLGLFVYPGVRPQDLRQAFTEAQRHGLVLDLHVDEHLAPAITHLPLIAQLAREHGLAGRVLCSHACVLSVLPEDERGRVLDQLAEARIGLVALPYTNLYLQDAGRHDGLRRTPRLRGLLPVHEARRRGIALAFAADNHRDPFFPAGDLDPLQLLALATLAAQLDDPLADWSDTITRAPAQMLGLAWDGLLRAGAPADLVLHPGRSNAEVLARAATGRQVLRAGQRLTAGEAALPDFRELDGLRRPGSRSMS
jgi:cytosine deaminase